MTEYFQPSAAGWTVPAPPPIVVAPDVALVLWSRRVAELQLELAEARVRRDQLALGLLASGATGCRVAQLAGVSGARICQMRQRKERA